jgi:membrane-bound lytic murein transglycosylase D
MADSKTGKMRNIIFSIVGIVALALIVKVFSFSANEEQKQTEPKAAVAKPDSVDNHQNSNYQQHIRDNYKIFSLPMPENVSFAGEKVPVDILDIKERLDKELTVNTYWHSQTVLFHKRASRWFPIIEPILKENGIPDDFKYLAVIESGLDNVVSPAGASGFWQFMKSTGTGYGLEINKFVDERYQLEKSTLAACKYLKTAYKKFNSWTLAAASYNMGKGGVAGQLQKQKVGSYYDLLLNNETSRYVFRIVAAKYILSNSENYGFNMRQKDLYQPYKTKTIEVDSTINNIADFALSQGVNYKILKTLNPWIRQNSLPNSSRKKYSILLPADDSTFKPVGNAN